MDETLRIKNQLEQIIGKFYDVKSDADDFKKEADSYNKEIKELMAKINIEDYTTEDGLVAKKSIQKRESFNEPNLINYLKENDFSDAIDLVEVINYDKLEDMIYNGKLIASDIAEFRETKEVVTLKVSKKKGE